MTCFVDFDCVLNDFHEVLIREYNQRYYKSVHVENITSWDWPEGDKVGLRAIYEEPDFWVNFVRPLPDIHVWLYKIFDITPGVIATHISTNEEATDKMRWFDTHMPYFKKRVFIGTDKTLIVKEGDIVIDDHPVILQVARRAGAHTLALDRPWNQEKSDPPWDGWRGDHHDVLKAVEALTAT